MRSPGAVALLSLALAAEAAAAEEPEPVAIALSPHGTVRVPVEIDGTGPLTFLLDTGSTHSVVSADLADRLKLPVVARTRILTAAGAQEALVVKVERMTVGGASRSGLMPSVAPLARLREAEPGVDGIIGQDFMSAFDFTLDYRRKRLVWMVEHGEERFRLPLVRVGDRPLVRLPGTGTRPSVTLVPDSGANGFVIFARGGRTAVRARVLDDVTLVSAMTSAQFARRAILGELQVGAVILRDQPAVIVPREGASANEVDGLLPLSRFATVAFKNSEGWLAVGK